MRKLSLLLLVACAIAVPASAQMKVRGKETCAKPDSMQSVDAGDKPGHSLMIQKGTCTWSTPFEIAGLKAVSSVDVSTGEAWGPNVTQHGYDTATMDNGDTITSKYSGTMKVASDGTATFNGTWSVVSATGKLKGISGSGSYGGTGAADGSGTSDVKGEMTLGMHPMSTAAKPAN
jgi:hypothetical protein